MSSDPQVNQEGQPSLMFPVVGADGRGADNPELIDHSAFSDGRAMVSGDVVDTNWDIPRLSFLRIGHLHRAMCRCPGIPAGID